MGEVKELSFGCGKKLKNTVGKEKLKAGGFHMAGNNVNEDLLIILNLNAKLNYQRKAEVKKVHAEILQKELLKTPLGLKYTKRLGQISNGTDTSNKCILCIGDLDNCSLICTKCIKRYRALQFQKERIF